jgi:putative ABC transport system substrate-binding protein
MTELGYVEGQNIQYVYSGGVGEVEALDQEVRNIIAQKVDLVFAITTPATMKVQLATAGTNLPVVFAPVNDPVASGVVKSLSRPGGNLTGIRTGGFTAKELEWLVSLAPNTRRVFVAHNPDDGSSVVGLAASKEAANKLGIQLLVHEARTPEQLNTVFASFPEDVDAILILTNNMALDRITDFVKVAQERHLPLASVSYAQLEAGALMTYGPDFFQVGRQAARLADKVLKDTSPADLPVETSEFFLSVNLRTAQAIGLTIPDEVLQQADRVIR